MAQRLYKVRNITRKSFDIFFVTSEAESQGFTLRKKIVHS